MKHVFRYNDKDSSVQLANSLKQLCGDNLVYFCIGSDKLLPDSVGPKVGTRLKERSHGSLTVYGMEGNAINALNVQDAYKAVRCLHPKSKIFVIDASVDYRKGIIRINNDGVRPGSGVGKDLGKVGNFGIMCATINRGCDLKAYYDYMLISDPDNLFYREPTKRFKRFQKFIDDAADAIADAILLAAA